MFDAIRALLPEGWDIDNVGFGLDSLLECPHGHKIEQDGTCPDGCVSPLSEKGFI